MTLVRFLALFGCMAALFLACAGAGEDNVWPVRVAQTDADGSIQSWQALGPLLFKKPAADGGTISGFRPFYVQTTAAINDQVTEAAVLYPLFIYRADSEAYQWSVFQLINRSGRIEGTPAIKGQKHETFDVWPFWFSRQTDAPETSYRALFPIGGTIRNRFWNDRLSWVLWPLYLKTEKQGVAATSVPWPIVRITQGSEQGFALWPLFGWLEKPEKFRTTYYLWPLVWNNTLQPDDNAPAGTPPARQTGFIPFYTHESRAGYLDENFGWPFFGYTDRTVPNRYHEVRYLWPFLVQGRGDDRYIDRWAPFYTHSVIKGMDKTWVLWPLVRQATWTDAGIRQTQTQLLYALYWSLEQRSTANPHAAPADRTHFWPLFSKWDNGAGRQQFQLFSPLDVFFPTNDQVRETWTPLFAIYRSDNRAPENRRWSVLWNAVTWRREHTEREFRLGPLLSVESGSAQGRVAIGNGLVGWKREPGAPAWHFFWFDFPSNTRKLSPASR